MPVFDDAALARYVSDALSQGPQRPATGIGPGPYLAMAGGNAADILSTIYAKEHGSHEANPVLGEGNFWPLLAAKLASMAGQMYGVHKLADSGHPTAAKVTGYLLGAVPAAVAAHNVLTAK